MTRIAQITRAARNGVKRGAERLLVADEATPAPARSADIDVFRSPFARHLCPVCPIGKTANRNCCRRRKTITRIVTKTRTVVRKQVTTRTKTTKAAGVRNQVVSGRLYVGLHLSIPQQVFSDPSHSPKIDKDGSGTYTPGDLPLANVVLLLVRIPGSLARYAPLQTTSDANGAYAFPPSPVGPGDVFKVVESGTGTALQEFMIGSEGAVPQGGFSEPVKLSTTSLSRTETVRTEMPVL